MFQAYALHSESGARSRSIVLRSQVALTGPGAEKRTGWAHIAKVGEWSGHPSGRFKLTREHFLSAIEVFEGQETPPVFDYEHATEFGTPTGEAPASGWIHKLELRSDDLWALVEWSEKAAAYIRAGEYRFTSSVFLLDAPDRETGEPLKCRLKSAALTNTPFMDGLTPLALSERATNSARAEKVETMTVAASDKPIANAEEGASPEAAIAARLMEASGMSAEDLMSAVEKNLDAIIAALKSASEESAEEESSEAPESMAAKDAEIKALTDRLAAFEKREREAAIAEVDAAIAEKRVPAEIRSSLVALAERSPEVLRADLRKAPAPVVYPAGRQASAIVSNTNTPAEDPRAVALSEQFKSAGVTNPDIINKYVARVLAGKDN